MKNQETVFIACMMVLAILFMGEPDLMSAIIANLMK